MTAEFVEFDPFLNCKVEIEKKELVHQMKLYRMIHDTMRSIEGGKNAVCTSANPDSWPTPLLFI